MTGVVSLPEASALALESVNCWDTEDRMGWIHRALELKKDLVFLSETLILIQSNGQDAEILVTGKARSIQQSSMLRRQELTKPRVLGRVGFGLLRDLPEQRACGCGSSLGARGSGRMKRGALPGSSWL